MKTLVVIESTGSQIKRNSLELLSFAQSKGLDFAAICFGKSASQMVPEIEKFGAKKIYLNAGPETEFFQSEIYSETLKLAVADWGPKAILGSASSQGRDFFPLVAAKLDTCVVTDAISLDFQGPLVRVQKPMLSGKCFATVSLNPEKPQMVLMRANQLPIHDPKGGKAETINLSTSSYQLKAAVKSVVKGASSKLDLTEANKIVSGGRGLKEAANFKLLEQLADVLSASVGASRAVVDAGWVPHNMQVGQTGKTVAPSLYIAVGISGAIQHLAGMSGSKVVVAINNDPNAPIFQKASYGIVGDLFEIVPLLTEEFKKSLQ